MTMEPIFDVQLEGQLDQPRLDRLRKLLNLQPQGRLTDTEDASFGRRALRDVADEWLWLDLWRRNETGWSVRLTFTGPRPAHPVVAQCLAEVLGAAAALGLAVTRIWPAPAEPVPAARRRELPTGRALSVRLAGGARSAGRLATANLQALQGTLGLHRERGGLTGTEFGWRYLRWAPPDNSVLLQLFDDPDTGTQVALLFDRQPPPAEVVDGCRQEVAQAAERAGMTTTATPG
jgi:hypothetical protein